MSEWQQDWLPTEHDNRLHELATRYHALCEACDRTVCTGPIGRDGIMPASPHEMAMSNRNAYAVRKLLEEEAQREGIGREELSRAISKWYGSLPNPELTSAKRPVRNEMTNEVERVVKCYRCGYCGRPTNEHGAVFIEQPLDMAGYETAEPTHGDCCRHAQEREMVQVTREMAMDAKDMRLEGQWIEW